MASSNVIIVGGGLAGLMAAIKSAEAGVHVHLFSLVPVKDPIPYAHRVALTER